MKNSILHDIKKIAEAQKQLALACDQLYDDMAEMMGLEGMPLGGPPTLLNKGGLDGMVKR